MPSRSLMMGLLPLALGLLAGGCDRKSAAPEQANALIAATAAAAPAPDEVQPAAAAPAGRAPAIGEVDRSHKGAAAPAATFETPAGQPTTLAFFRGKPVLLNLWATWCGPCIKELPALDRTAAALGSKVAVLAVSQDLEAATVAPFLAQHGIRTLQPFRDPKLALSLAYQANLPTTIMFDSRGREVWRVTGSIDWTTPAARALIAEAG